MAGLVVNSEKRLVAQIKFVWIFEVFVFLTAVLWMISFGLKTLWRNFWGHNRSMQSYSSRANLCVSFHTYHHCSFEQSLEWRLWRIFSNNYVVDESLLYFLNLMWSQKFNNQTWLGTILIVRLIKSRKTLNMGEGRWEIFFAIKSSKSTKIMGSKRLMWHSLIHHDLPALGCAFKVSNGHTTLQLCQITDHTPTNNGTTSLTKIIDSIFLKTCHRIA